MELWEIESELDARYCDWQAARQAVALARRSDRAELELDEARAKESYLELRAEKFR